MTLKIKHGFIDQEIKSSNQEFGSFTLRTWDAYISDFQPGFHHELIKKSPTGNPQSLSWKDYFQNHSIPQLEDNNLTNKMLKATVVIIKSHGETLTI